MIAPAATPTLLRLSDAAAVLTLAAVGVALLLPDAYAAVPDHLRPAPGARTRSRPPLRWRFWRSTQGCGPAGPGAG